MKIGIYDPYIDDIGGGEKYMLTIAHVLSQNNDVFVFWDNKEDLLSIEKRFSINLSKVKLTPNIFSSKTSFLKRLLSSKKYDAIIVLSDGSLPYVLSKKLYIHIQQPIQEFEKDSIKNKIKLSRVNRFFCNSEFTKNLIYNKFQIKTVVIYPPVVIHAKKVKKTNSILHVGRFRVKNTPVDDYKKQHVMITCFKEMVNRGLKGWVLDMVVSFPEKDKDTFEKMRKTAAGYPILFHINETNDKLWDYYSKAKIYWHASGYGEDLDKHPEYAEHFGISTVEAMGAGVVPVVINAGGQKEIVTDGENGLFWSTTPELIENTLILIHSKDIMSELSKNAKIRALDFSADEFSTKIKEMVEP